ncbi:hypothetical protein [Luteipulveratus halotolerans]|uniref:hypothetical protein n=1 Tax=Luteipulveratus halotolerans TaxID=1631356 RepID=UPI000680CDD0|nr:hypothetical protein [Luteipulveratus halotolerans]
MQLYADAQPRRTRQIVTDVLVLVWVLAWIKVALEVRDRASGSGRAADPMRRGGDEFASSMSDAGDKLQKVPVVGDTLKPPFDRASKAGSAFSQAGRDIQSGMDNLGLLLGILVAALPICLVVAFWAQARLRYARDVRRARSLEGITCADAALVRRAVGLDLDSLGLRPRAATTAAAASTTAVATPPEDEAATADDEEGGASVVDAVRDDE